MNHALIPQTALQRLLYSSWFCNCFFISVLQVTYNYQKKTDLVFCAKTVEGHWASLSRSSQGDDVPITSPHWGAMLSHEKSPAKQSIICLIPALLPHDLGWHFFSGSPGHAWSGSSMGEPPVPHGFCGISHAVLSRSHRDGQASKLPNQHSRSYCHRNRLQDGHTTESRSIRRVYASAGRGISFPYKQKKPYVVEENEATSRPHRSKAHGWHGLIP